MRPFLFTALLFSLAAQADALLVDRVAAVVDGHPITRSLVTLRAQARMKSAATKDEKAKVLAETLETLIEERLIQEDARRLRLVIASEDIDRALAEIGKQTQLSPEALQAELKRQGLTLTEYRASIGQMLLELKWLNLKLNRTSALDPDRARDLAERTRFLAALRAEFAVEVRQ
ncbi:MAG: SurA N-terminal domain-containing protein [Myxococcales bacterium]|nr:SurA N-terminal domain-containing protein [Myxococcales bacterium]